jgi:hypothetical protein
MEMMPATRQMRQRMVDEQLSWPADVFMQATKPAEELYDIIADPHCVHNLAGDARFGEVLDLLGSELSQWIKRIGDKGYTTERQLIAQGIVQNRLDEEYALRVEPLPEAMRMGGVYDTRLTQEDV